MSDKFKKGKGVNRANYYSYIEEKFYTLAQRITGGGKLNMLSLHLHSEGFYQHFFNLLYGYNLINLNQESQNVEAIDLIDRKEQIIIQVSSIATKAKIEGALGKDSLANYGEYTFKFISIAKDASHLRKNSYKNPHHIQFEPSRDIYDTTSILNEIKDFDIDKLKCVYEFIVKELGEDANRLNSNLTVKSSTYDNSFVGREDEIRVIDEMLNQSNSMLLINGIGGIGKSSLANYYLYIREKEFDYYGFIDGLGSFISEFRNALDLKAQKEQELHREIISKLQGIRGKKLLVIDNVEDIEANRELIEMILSLVKYDYKILFTSRRKIKKVNAYHLGTLLKEDAQKLFLSYYQADEIKKVDKIIDDLGLHTLFIKLVAETVQSEGYSLDDILAKFENGELSKIEFIDEESGDEITFNHNLEELFSMQNLKDEYILLLKRLAVLPSIDIELSFVEEILGKERLKGRLNFLVARGWLIENEGSYKLHQIIKEFVLSNYAPSFEEVEKLFDYFMNIVIQNDNIKLLILSQLYIVFLEELYKFLNNLNIENLKVAIFLGRLARFYHEFGWYDNAEFLYKKVLNINKNVLNNDESLMATIYNNLAELYRLQGINNDMVEILLLKSLEVNMKLYEETHSSIAMNFNNLGVYYLSQGSYNKALKILVISLKIYRDILDENDLILVRIYNNMAECYRLVNKNKEALDFSFISLSVLINNFEINHPDFAFVYNTMGLIYLSLEDYKKSKKYLYRSLKINQYNWGNNHINTAQNYFSLGILFKIIKNRKALDFHLRALVIREKKLGKIHLSTAESYYIVSILFFEKENYKQAYKFLKNVLKIYKEIFPVDNPQLITLKNELKYFEEKLKASQ